MHKYHELLQMYPGKNSHSKDEMNIPNGTRSKLIFKEAEVTRGSELQSIAKLLSIRPCGFVDVLVTSLTCGRSSLLVYVETIVQMEKKIVWIAK